MNLNEIQHFNEGVLYYGEGKNSEGTPIWIVADTTDGLQFRSEMIKDRHSLEETIGHFVDIFPKEEREKTLEDIKFRLDEIQKTNGKIEYNKD